MIDRSNGSRRTCGRWLVGLLAAGFMAAPAAAGEPSMVISDDSMAAVGARPAWRLALPLSFVTSIQAYHLVDEYLYAVGNDGAIRAIRADTGERMWTNRLATPGARFWPPVAYRSPLGSDVAFPVLDQVLFLDPATGADLTWTETKAPNPKDEPKVHPIGPLQLDAGNIASVAVGTNRLFAAAPGRLVDRYDIAKGEKDGCFSTSAPVELAPVYIPEIDLLLIATTDGTILGIEATKGRRVLKWELRGKPMGCLTVDNGTIYVATTEPRLYGLDILSGSITLEYRLPGRPVGGPVATRESIYQATREGGLQRIGREPKWRNWNAPQVRRFLAEWPGKVVLLRHDGRLEWVRSQTDRRGEAGETLAVVDVGEQVDGISNPLNAAAILTTARGEICCLRPIGAKPLTQADFRPIVVPRPAPEGKPNGALADAGPAPEVVKGAKEEETEADKKPRLTPLERILADPLRSRYQMATEKP